MGFLYVGKDTKKVAYLRVETMALVAKKGTTSPVWQFFGLRPDESGQPRDMMKFCARCAHV